MVDQWCDGVPLHVWCVTCGCGVQAVCTEAGMLALRERRMRVTQDDFRKAKEKALYKKKGNIPEGLYV